MLPLRLTVVGLQEAVGGSLSWTVTVAVHWLLLPSMSLTVKVTVFPPKSLHPKLLGLTERLAEQLSEEPSSTSFAVIVAVLPLRLTVVGLQEAVGGSLSSTVTVAVHWLLLPSMSLTVKVTVFPPKSPQPKLLGLTERLAEQLSEEPSSTSFARNRSSAAVEADGCRLTGSRRRFGVFDGDGRRALAAIAIHITDRQSDGISA